MDIEVARTKSILRERMETIRGVAMQIPSGYQLPWLAFLRELLVNELRGIQIPLDAEPEVRKNQSGRMQITRGDPSEFRVSEFFCMMLCNLRDTLHLDDMQFTDAIDNFLIHELVHRGQGFAEEGHSGLAQRARRVVGALDYQADAWAVLIHFSLANIAPKAFTSVGQARWDLYARLLRAVLFQTYLFRLMEEVEGDEPRLRSPQDARDSQMDVYSLERVASWHYQFHRAKMFNRCVEVGDFQLLVRPELAFRNTPRAAGKLTSKWPEHELNDGFNTANTHPLVVTGVTRYGLSKAVRFTPANPEHYAQVFHGIFSCDTSQGSGSAPFFRRLFVENPEFTLMADLPPVVPPPYYGSANANTVELPLDEALKSLQLMFTPSLPFAPVRAYLVQRGDSGHGQGFAQG